MNHEHLKSAIPGLALGAALLCVCSRGPHVPLAPSGPSRGGIVTEYSFASSAEDPRGGSVAIRFDWRDGDTSDWSLYVRPGATMSASHSWADPGSYTVKAQARDQSGATSNWSAEHSISIAAGWTRTFGGPGSMAAARCSRPRMAGT